MSFCAAVPSVIVRLLTWTVLARCALGLPRAACLSDCMPGSQTHSEAHSRGALDGNDVRDLCRHLSSRLFASKAEFHPIFDFLSSLHSNGTRLMLGESITTYEEMGTALTKAEKLLENMDAEV